MYKVTGVSGSHMFKWKFKDPFQIQNQRVLDYTQLWLFSDRILPSVPISQSYTLTCLEIAFVCEDKQIAAVFFVHTLSLVTVTYFNSVTDCHIF